MKDFVLYMLFSGFEYLATLFLTFCLFNLDFRSSIREIFITSGILIIITYLIVKNEMITTIPIPIIMFILFVLMLIKILGNKRWKYSIVVAISGLLTNLFLQIGITMIFKYFGVITQDNINDAFSIKTYIMQTLYSSVAISIGLYTKIYGNGFGFMLRKGKALKFLLVTIALFAIILLCWLSFNILEIWSLIIGLGIITLVSLLIIFVLSSKRDDYEYFRKGGET